MGGGLMQLVAYGAQDVYLTGNPQITFFKVVYRRYTNFSIESIRQTFNGQLSSGPGKSVATISRNGDLVYQTYLVLSGSISSGNIMTNYGHNVIDFIDVEIGGQLIDRHYGYFMEAWAQLTEPNPTRNVANLNAIAGTGGNGDQLINNASLVAINSITNINYFTKFQAMACAGGVNGAASVNLNQDLYVPLRFWFCKEPGSALPLIALQYHEVKITVNFTESLISPIQDLWCDYIYLDTDERRRFAQVSHEYLIEQVQLNIFDSSTTTCDLQFNHPVKELIWISITSSYHTSATDSFSNITDDDIPTFLIKLNGHDRMEKRKISYFTKTQPYQYHTGCGLDSISSTGPPTNNHTNTIALYSFCLKPEEHQPSGTCNFSRIDNAQLIVNDGTFTASRTIHIYAINYNVLRIMSGMGGLAYSN